MTQAIPKTVTFDEFIAWYPENSEHRYELHKGLIVEMPKPTGKHSEIASFLAYKLNVAIDSQGLNCFVPRECVVRPVSEDSGYEPDIVVLDRHAVTNEPRWAKESIITMGASVRLVVEVVSTNWRDDYLTKARDYEEMGVPEYWIVDYLGLGGRRFIGAPKQPTLSVYQLVDGEYQVSQFQGSNPIESPAFPSSSLTAEQIFAAGMEPVE